jgi:hypothetical protein
MRFEQGRGVREERRGGVDADGLREVDREVDEVKGGITGGDHASFELRTSWLDGSSILRVISNVVRHRICRRAPLRHATCVAVGDGTETDVAGAGQWTVFREA